jgi:deoxyribose-phosphate aldolase
MNLPKTRRELARLIDHTQLKPEATQADIERLCDECRAHHFFAACVNPIWVARCAVRLAGSDTLVASVAGFPLGASASEVKAHEAQDAIEHGAREVDMVTNLAALIECDWAAVTRDIAAVVEAVKQANAAALVKVILETRILGEEQIVRGCQCAIEAQADFVKTSTGFHPAGGATVEHVRLLRQHAGPMRVKAAGGIRALPAALAMIDAGAARLGTSSSVAIVQAR